MSSKGTSMGSNPKASAGDVVTEESVCIEFCAPIDCQLVNNNCMKFLGLDTNEVILQTNGNTFFSGQLHNTLGTNVLFEVKNSAKKSHSHESNTTADDNDSKLSLEYVAKCEHKLVMKRVFLEPHAPQDTTDHSLTSTDHSLTPTTQ